MSYALAILVGILVVALTYVSSKVEGSAMNAPGARFCCTCGRWHVDNSPERIGGYQPCPRPDLGNPNPPPRYP